MKQSPWPIILRWICVLPAVGLSFIVSIFLAVHFNSFVYEQLYRFGIVVPHNDGIHFELVWDGLLAAVLFILSGALIAPRYKTQVALGLFVLGALLTPGLVRDFDFSLYGMSPDMDKLSAIAHHWAIASTYMGGVLAVVCVFVATRGSAARSS